MIPGKRVRGGDSLLERAAEDVSSQAGGIRAEADVAGAADKQDPAAVPEPPGGQRAAPQAAAIGEGLSNQRHHQQVITARGRNAGNGGHAGRCLASWTTNKNEKKSIHKKSCESSHLSNQVMTCCWDSH